MFEFNIFGFGGDIHKAAQFGNFKKLEKLLKKGIDPNKLNAQGATPLFYTANTGSVNCARLLVEYGADVNFVVPGGGTPLHSALLKKHEDLTRWLILEGANVNAATSVGVTPLHLAAQAGLASTVAGLLREEANINALTQKGQSALFLAFYGMYSEENDNNAALVLFEEGADPRLPDEFEMHLEKLVELSENIADTLKYGLGRLIEKGCAPEIEEYAQKMLNRLFGEAQHEEGVPRFIESALLGRLEQSEFADWWMGPELHIPLWNNKPVRLNYRFDPDTDPDFLPEADAAVRNFLRKGPEALKEATPHLDWNFKACCEIIYDGVTRDMLTDWQREVLDHEDRNRLWELISPYDYMYVARRHRRDRDIYIVLPCSCEWEEEHGLQLVYRRGLMLTKLDQIDDHLTEADALDIPDEGDKLLSEFNRRYGPPPKTTQENKPGV